MRGTIKNLIHKARLFTATFLLLAAQALAPISAFIPKASAANEITASDHEGQMKPASGGYSNGNITTYTELDSINFRFTLESSTTASGQMQVRFTADDGFCEFFDGSFTLGTHDSSAAAVVPVSGTTPTVSEVGTATVSGDEWVQVLNVDFAGAGKAVVNYYITLTNEAGDCNGSSQHSRLNNVTGPASGNFANIGAQNVPVPAKDIIELATITVTKMVDTDGNGQADRTATAGEWNFSLNGGTPVSTNSSGQVIFTNLQSGSYTITESGPSEYSFYSVTGTNCVAGQISGSAIATVTAAPTAVDATCTFTNTRALGNLKVVKDVVNGNGGTKTSADFTFTVNGGAPQTFIPTIGPDGERTLILPTGTYTVVEPEANTMGYATTYENCTSVVVVAGQTQTCTITNNDIPGQLRVLKSVINNNGGSATANDFTLSVNGNSRTQGQYYSANQGTTYTVTETGPSGYAMTGIVCVDDDTQQVLAHPVQVALDQSVTCTVTNDDIAPKLTLVKVVTNDDGGDLEVSDFPLFVGDVQVTSGEQNTFSAGSYVLSETNQPGYTAGSWTGTDCNLGNITLVVGGVYTCTITNDDQPAYIKVTKVVVNDNGGNAVVSDFTLKVDDINVVSGVNNSFNGNEEYTVSETNIPNGYTQTSLVCNDVTGQSPVPVGSTFTAQLGHSYECVVTNDDIAPGLTVIKKVVNDNGGSAVVDSFDLEINDNDLSFGSGVVNGDETTYTATPAIASNTDYTLSEIDFDGYTEGTWSCTDGTEGQGLTVTVNLNEAENVTCTITNNDIAPTLTLKKAVTNDDGGDNLASEWTLKAQEGANTPVIDTTGTGHPVATTGAVSVMAATTYTLSESGPSGYTASEWVCTSDGGPAFSHPNGLTNEVRMNPGANVTCTITNNDIAPMLTLVKHVTNNNGGIAVASEWTLTANPIIGDSITGNGDDGVVDEEAVSNKEYFLEEQGPDGYEVSVDWSCDGGVFDAEDNSVTLGEGDDVTCEITNDDIAPSLTIVKQTNSPSGDLEFDFTGDLGEFDLMDEESEVADDLSVGSYEITENAPTGWKLGYVDCDADFDEVFVDDKLVGIDVELGLADDVTCTFYNDKLGEVSGYKFEDVDANGEWDEGEPALEGWTINLIRICEEAEITLELLIDINDIAIPEEECEEALVDTQVTDENGAYKFENIDFGTYKVCEELQDGWVQTYPEWNDGCHQGSIFESGQVEEDINFGNFQLAESNGFKFEDANGNRMWDEGEKALSGWTINLWQCVAGEEVPSLRQVEVPCEDEIVAADVTDENGAYSFEGLEPGDYTVCEVQQSGWTRTLPADSDCYEFEVEESGQVVTNNFGNKRITRVLGELVNTGTPMWAGLAVGLSILGLAGAATFLTRRQIATSNK